MVIDPDLSICVVTHNSLPRLRAFLLAVEKAEAPLHVEIIVVDNGSTDETAARIHDRWPHILLFENSRAEACSVARNRAMKLARGRYVLIADQETLFQPGALKSLVDFMDAHPDTGIAGPRVLDPQKAPLSSARGFPSIAVLLACHTPFGDTALGKGLLKKHVRDETGGGVAREVDWLVGACLVVRRHTVEDIGFFDERFTGLYDDAEYCLRAKRAGWHVWQVGDAAVQHGGIGRFCLRSPASPSVGEANLDGKERLRSGLLFIWKKWRNSLLLTRH